MREVDPNSDEARRRRAELSRPDEAVSDARRAAVPYARAALLAAATAIVLAFARPELVRGYAWLVAALAALPFLHTVFVGAATNGWVVPRPFGLRPFATVATATVAFTALLSVRPSLAATAGPALAGGLVGIVLAGAALRWVAVRLTE